MRINELDRASELLDQYHREKMQLRHYVTIIGAKLYFDGHPCNDLRKTWAPELRTTLVSLQLAECRRLLTELETIGVTTDGEREELAAIAATAKR